MASAEVINAVVDAVVAAFNSDPALWSAFLVRSRLETEMLELQSARRKLQAIEDAQNAGFNAEMVANQEAITAKQAEIDALE